jgi:hypothetical protein
MAESEMFEKGLQVRRIPSGLDAFKTAHEALAKEDALPAPAAKPAE